MHFFELILLTFLGIQVLYLAFYLGAFLRKEVSGKQTSAPVSIIVCAHDEEQNLRELVPLLLRQAYDAYEIIIVEDRSNDESFDYLYQMSQQHERLRLLPIKDKPEHMNGKKFALTLGIKAARYEWILFTDADCRPSNDQWIEEMSHHFANETAIVLGYSPYERSPGLLNTFIRFESLITAIQYMGMAIMGMPYMGVGRNMAYRKRLFLENTGFKSHLSVTGGDDDLFVNEVSTKENTAVCFGASSIVYSKPKATWGEFYIQKLRHLSVGKRYKMVDKLRLSIFNLSWIGLWLMIIPAVLYSSIVYIPIGAFVVRIILLVILTHMASRRLGDAFEAWKSPFLDFIFAIYYLVTGLVALQTNKVRWKKT